MWLFQKGLHMVTAANAVGILKSTDTYPYPEGVTSAKNFVPTYDKVIGYNVVPTTAKTKGAFGSPGSNRQAVLELLALTEVLVREDPDVKAVVMLKACVTKFKMFVYFPKQDLLIMTCDVTLEESNNRESMMGCLILFFLLQHKINLEFPIELLQR